MPVTKFQTLREAVEAVLDSSDSSEDEELVDICILPPQDGAESESKNANEDILMKEFMPSDVARELKIFKGSEEVHEVRSSNDNRSTKKSVKTKQKIASNNNLKEFEPQRKQLKAAGKKNVNDSAKDLHVLESELERVDEAEDEESSCEISTKTRSGRTSKKIVANSNAKELEPPKKVINTKSKKNFDKKNKPKWKANQDKFSKKLAPNEPSPLANSHPELVAKNPIDFSI